MKPVMALTETPFVILVNPSIEANDLDALVEYTKAHPGELNFGASGVGSSGHMRGEQFMTQNEVELTFIPYQDGGSTLAALVGNEIQVAFDTLPGSIGMVRDGRLKLLAVGTKERFFLTPDTPTLEDQGYTNLAPQWIGAYVPKETPDDVTSKLAEAMATALETPDVQKQLQNLGFTTVGTGPEDTLKNSRGRDADVVRYDREGRHLDSVSGRAARPRPFARGPDGAPSRLRGWTPAARRSAAHGPWPPWRSIAG